MRRVWGESQFITLQYIWLQKRWYFQLWPMVNWNLCATRAWSTWASRSSEAPDWREWKREERSGNWKLEWIWNGYQGAKEQRGNTRYACSQCHLFWEHKQTTKPLFHPYWLFKFQHFCSCQVILINYSVTQIHHLPKKERLSWTGPKPRRDYFNLIKSTYCVKNQLLSHHRHPQEKERGRSPRRTVGSETTQCCSMQWDSLGQEQGAQGCCSPVYCMLHRTLPKPGLVSRLGIASDTTHTTLSDSLVFHLSQFLHLWNRAS